MGVDIQTEMDPGPLNAILGGITAVASDLSEFYRTDAEDVFNDWMAQVFRTQGQINGKKWEEWGWLGNFVHNTDLPGHEQFDRGNKKIGESTGRLMDSLIEKGDPNARMVITPTTYTRGTNARSPWDGAVPYPELFVIDHVVTSLWGKPIRRTEVPGRPIMDPLPSFFENNISTLCDSWMDKKLSTFKPL